MTIRVRGVLVVSALLVVWSPPVGRASAPHVTQHLDAYLAGDFDQVVRALETRAEGNDLGDILDGLKDHGADWIAAGGADRDRRVLAAATYALEAGRAGAFSEWKWISVFRQTFQSDLIAAPAYKTIVWFPPPRLIEWGCALLRTQPRAEALERVWHLAALSAAHLSGDFELLIGSPYDERHNEHEEIEHLKHSRARFPKEPRFLLGQATAIELATYPGRSASSRNPAVRDAMRAFGELADDPVVGAEALVRLGSLQRRTAQYSDAVATLSKAEMRTRDPYLMYLANFIRGEAHRDAGNQVEAETSFRRALTVVPRAQSASLALASLLYLSDRRTEAAVLTDAATIEPQPIDPWRLYGRGDYRFWPILIAQLRKAVAP